MKKKTVKSDDLSFDLFFRNSQMRDLLRVKVRVEIWSTAETTDSTDRQRPFKRVLY